MLSDQEVELEEIQSLENEFQWVLKHEVPQVMMDLNMVMKECLNKFPMSLCGTHRTIEAETFVLTTPSTTPTDQVKVVITLTGDAISHADINLKLPRMTGGGGVSGGGVAGKDLYQNTTIREDFPWILQQIQDSGNHLQIAVEQVKHIVTEMSNRVEGDNFEGESPFRSAHEVTSFLNRVMGSLQRSRTSLANPGERTLEELRSSKYAKGLTPPLSPELAVSFYLQNGKLVFAVYHVIPDQKTGGSEFNRYQADCFIPWVNDVVFLLSVALQKSQQLIDKVNVFSQYHDFPAQSPM